jgi:ribosomal protein S18 acetylase RimI-like enzyme
MIDEDLATVAEIEAGVFTDWYRMHRKPQNPLPERTIEELRYSTSLDPEANLVAIAADGAMVGFVLARSWGKVGWFGTFGVPTQFQGMSIGRSLIEAVTEQLRKSCRIIGLETMPESGSNIGLYTKTGFAVTFPTLILDFSLIQQADRLSGMDRDDVILWGEGDDATKLSMLRGMRSIADALVPGLDYACEIEAIREHRLGETVVAMDGGLVAGFAVVRTVPYRGHDTAGRGYIHILAIHPDADSGAVLLNLLRQIWSRCTSIGLTRLVTGLSGRYQSALELLMRNGFRGVRAAVRMVDRSSASEVFELSTGVNLARWAG